MIEVQNRGGRAVARAAAVLYLKHPQGQAEGKKKKKMRAGENARHSPNFAHVAWTVHGPQ